MNSLTRAPRCVCGHFNGSHAHHGLGNECTVLRVSGPMTSNDPAAHFGRQVTRCPCTGYQPEPLQDKEK